MKDTPEVRRFMHKKLVHYCKKLKLKGNRTPEIFFDGIVLKEKKNSILNDKKDYAHYIYDEDSKLCLIHVNLKMHKTLLQVEDSIAHELVHLTNDGLKHGAKFDKMVKELMNK